MSSTASSSPALRLPKYNDPFPKHKPYVLQAEEGETLSVVGGSTVRYLATRNETDNAFGLVQSRSGPDERVLPHFHNGAHDTWIVTKGAVRLWAGDQSRILLPGDFAYVPPKITHSYQVVGADTEFLGIISPGAWVEFFKVIGIPCDETPTYKALDTRTLDKMYIIEQIKMGHDIVPQFGYNWPEVNEGEDNTLPTETAAYFLRSDTGPKYLLNGQSNTPLCRSSNSDGNFSVSMIAGNGPIDRYPTFIHSRPAFESGPFKGGRKIKFENTNMLFRVIEGRVAFELIEPGSGEVHAETITCGESIMVRAGHAFRYSVESAYARMYSFAGRGSGLEEVFIEAGRLAAPKEMVGESEVDEVDEEKLSAAIKAIGADYSESS